MVVEVQSHHYYLSLVSLPSAPRVKMWATRASGFGSSCFMHIPSHRGFYRQQQQKEWQSDWGVQLSCTRTHTHMNTRAHTYTHTQRKKRVSDLWDKLHTGIEAKPVHSNHTNPAAPSIYSFQWCHGSELRSLVLISIAVIHQSFYWCIFRAALILSCNVSTVLHITVLCFNLVCHVILRLMVAIYNHLHNSC